MSFLPVRRTRVDDVRDPLLQLQNDMNQLFDRFLRSWNWPLPAMGDGWLAPAMDIEEDDRAYYLHFDLPGVDAKDLQVAVENGTLVVSGEKRQEQRREGRKAFSNERFYGRFYREIALPADADGDRIEAKLSRGVLTLTLPKTANPGGRKTIPIQGE